MKITSEKIEKTLYKFNSQLVAIIFIIALTLLIPVIEIISFKLKKEIKIKLWKTISLFNLRWFFYLGGLSIEIEGKNKIENNESAIYIANHLSGLDGMILLYVLGENAINIIGPSRFFPFPFSYWFKRSGSIDVQRSNIEKMKYKDSYSPVKAINKSVDELKNGRSLIIFPEGHVSLQRNLLYFHTGVTRIALAANKKVVPIGIIDVDRVIKKLFIFTPGVIKLIFGEPINVTEYYIKNKATLKKATLKLRDELKKILPKEYYEMEEDINDKKPTVVFLSLDNTIYDGYAQKDLIKYFQKIPQVEAKVWLYYVLYKFKIISEIDWLRYSTELIFSGWRANNLYSKVNNIFEKKLKFKIREKMRTIVTDHKKKGHKVIILTDAIAPLAKCFADYLDADYFISSFLEEKNMHYTGKLLDFYTNQDLDKIHDLLKNYNFDLKQSFGYAHNFKDLAWINLMKYRNIINPNNEMENYVKNNNKGFYKINL